ncbi:hypothetical protein [Azotobacter chroococcum]|uniref:hypothetical protein n=1 Tax=Azotobacter chroococcum TaxID=353 RepID=UPI0010AEC883|nr:hypothetical protein [Azotobacter chroococcum]TKD47329.1 hypothetical protein FCG41_00115 [Azotobacter chroococcum]
MDFANASHGATHLARSGRLQPFETLRQTGLSATSLTRCNRYRRKRERQGARVALMVWPDGIWCVLAMHPTRAGLVVLGDDSKAGAYEDARQMIRDGFLPLLALRSYCSP